MWLDMYVQQVVIVKIIGDNNSVTVAAGFLQVQIAWLPRVPNAFQSQNKIYWMCEVVQYVQRKSIDYKTM